MQPRLNQAGLLLQTCGEQIKTLQHSNLQLAEDAIPMNLPLTCDVRPGESLASFTSRLAACNGLSAAEFCRDHGISFQSAIDGNTDCLYQIAALAKAPAQALEAWTPRKARHRSMDFRGHLFSSKTLKGPQVRGCLACLAEDAKSASGPIEHAMALRGEWSIPHVQICLRHQTPLVPLWYEPKPTLRYDSPPRFKEILPKLLASPPGYSTCEPTDFDVWLAERLNYHKQENWLDDHPLHAAASFCQALGYALQRLPDQENSRAWHPYARGFEVAKFGPESIKKSLQKLHYLPLGPQAGAKKIYPKLFERLTYDTMEDPDFAPFREILREHMIETWPLTKGENLLGATPTKRRLHSVRTAAREYQIDQRRMRKMLAAAEVIPASDAPSARPDVWEVFDADGSENLLRKLKRLVSAKEFAASLHMSRSQFDLLVRGKILRPSLSTDDVKTIWDPDTGAAFLTSLFSRSCPLIQATAPWVSIAKSAQRLKINPAEIVRAIQNGQLHRVGQLVSFKGYAALLVDHEEVSSMLQASPLEAMSIEEFSKQVGFSRPSNLKRLISCGYVQVSECRNPRTRRLQTYFTTSDMSAFHREFATPRLMAGLYRRNWQSLLVELKRAGVKPFRTEAENFGPIYRLEAVFKALGDPPK